ncbi:MAG: hypothetical protein ACO35E_07350 [Ilumatobacteraceae bacterium]
MPTETIADLVARCEAGRREAQAWSEHLAAVALAAGPGATQRLAVAGTHRLGRIADLWAARRPTVPLDPPDGGGPSAVGAPGSLAGLRVMLERLLADTDAMLDAVDPDLDPATRDLARRVASEARDLLAIHDRLLP